MNFIKLIIFVTVLMVTPLMAQEVSEKVEQESKTEQKPEIEQEVLPVKHRFDVGVGLGCDYAGVIGLKLSYLPIPYISVFASGGFAMVAFGWNFGLTYHILPKTTKYSVRPHIKAMYGYNEIIVLFDNKKYNDIYFGFTVGVGVEFRFGKKRRSGFDLDLNLPFRSKEFKKDFKMIDEDPDVDIKKPLPLAFAAGYHYEF